MNKEVYLEIINELSMFQDNLMKECQCMKETLIEFYDIDVVNVGLNKDKTIELMLSIEERICKGHDLIEASEEFRKKLISLL